MCSNSPNHRIGVVFVFQHRLFRLLQWQKPSHTLSALAVYSFVCLDPYLLAVLPVACVLLFIMVPSFVIRHPPPPSMPMEKYTAHGPAIAPPPEVKAVSEMSKVVHPLYARKKKKRRGCWSRTRDLTTFPLQN